MNMFSFYHFVRNPRESTPNVAALQQQVRALTAQVEEEKALRRREIEKEKALRRQEIEKEKALRRQEIEKEKALRQRMQRELENLTKIVTQLNKKAKDGIA